MSVVLGMDAYQWTALWVTIGAEAAGMGVLSWASASLRPRLWGNLAATVGINLLVHPLFWMGLHTIRPVGLPTLCGLELAVVVVEATLYRSVRGFGWGFALSVSLILNLFSYWMGVGVWMRL